MVPLVRTNPENVTLSVVLARIWKIRTALLPLMTTPSPMISIAARMTMLESANVIDVTDGPKEIYHTPCHQSST